MEYGGDIDKYALRNSEFETDLENTGGFREYLERNGDFEAYLERNAAFQKARSERDKELGRKTPKLELLGEGKPIFIATKHQLNWPFDRLTIPWRSLQPLGTR